MSGAFDRISLSNAGVSLQPQPPRERVSELMAPFDGLILNNLNYVE